MSHRTIDWLQMSIAERLTALRRSKSLTQQNMAEFVGLHITQIKRYEAGEAAPSLEAIKKIALAFSVTTDELIFDAAERGPDETLRLQFEAVRQFDDEDRLIAIGVLEGLMLKHQAKQIRTVTAAQRQQIADQAALRQPLTHPQEPTRGKRGVLPEGRIGR